MHKIESRQEAAVYHGEPSLVLYDDLWWDGGSRGRGCMYTQDGIDGKESAHKAGDQHSIPESGRSPGEGNGNPLQYSCLENSMVRGAWQATVHEVAKVGQD